MTKFNLSSNAFVVFNYVQKHMYAAKIAAKKDIPAPYCWGKVNLLHKKVAQIIIKELGVDYSPTLGTLVREWISNNNGHWAKEYLDYLKKVSLGEHLLQEESHIPYWKWLKL